MNSATATAEKGKSSNLFYLFLFLYFATLSADLLHLEIGLFKLKANNLIGALLFLILLLTPKGIALPRMILLPFSAIFFSLFVSALCSLYPARCLGYVAVYLFEFAVYFLLPYTLFTTYDRKKMLSCYLLSFQVVGLYALLQLLLSVGGIALPLVRQWIEPGGWARPHALSYEPSFYALYLCPFVFYRNTLYLLSKKSHSFWRVLWNNGLLLLSTATSAFFSYFLFLPLVVLVRRHAANLVRKVRTLIIGLAALLSLFFLTAPKIVLFFFKFFIHGFLSHHSFRERWEGITGAWSTFCSHPFLGVGIGGIGPYRFYREKMGVAPERSFGLSLAQAEMYDPTNVATEILAGLGLVGVAAFSLFALTLRSAFKQAEKIQEEKERTIALSLFISLFVMLLVLQFNPGLFRCYVWAHTATVLGYTAAARTS